MPDATEKTSPPLHNFPGSLCIERGCLEKIGELSKDIGSRVLIVSVQNELSSLDRIQSIQDNFEKHKIKTIVYDSITKKPGFEELDSLAYFIKRSKTDMLLAYGGRESMYAARAGALLSANKIFAKDLPQAKFPLEKPSLPLLTVPIGPIMGEEISPYLNIYDSKEAQQLYKKSPCLYPRISFSDPALSQGLGQMELSRLSLASLAASIEAVMVKDADDTVIAQGLYAADMIMHNLDSALEDKSNTEAFLNLNTGSAFAGIAYANSGFGLTYSLANCVDNMLHGVFYSLMNLLLPYIMEYNITLKSDKYVRIAKNWGEELHDLTIIEAAIKAIESIRKLGLKLQVPMRLSKFNINESQLSEVTRQVEKLNLIQNNPREATREDIDRILLAAY